LYIGNGLCPLDSGLRKLTLCGKHIHLGHDTSLVEFHRLVTQRLKGPDRLICHLKQLHRQHYAVVCVINVQYKVLAVYFSLYRCIINTQTCVFVFVYQFSTAEYGLGQRQGRSELAVGVDAVSTIPILRICLFQECPVGAFGIISSICRINRLRDILARMSVAQCGDKPRVQIPVKSCPVANINRREEIREGFPSDVFLFLYGES